MVIGIADSFQNRALARQEQLEKERGYRQLLPMRIEMSTIECSEFFKLLIIFKVFFLFLVKIGMVLLINISVQRKNLTLIGGP